MEGIERLQNEVLEMNNDSITAIFDYLKTRKELYQKFNNEEKSMKGMYEFIYNKAAKQKKNNVAMIQHNIVYLWAVTYFTKSNKELGIEEKKVMPPSAAEVSKKIEKDAKKNKEKEEPKKENENQISMFQEVQK